MGNLTFDEFMFLALADARVVGRRIKAAKRRTR